MSANASIQRVRFLARALKAAANPAKAEGMAGYMKTNMPFYGVQKPARTSIVGEMLARYPVESRADYTAAVKALWARPHREEKYAAIHVARQYPSYVTIGSLPLYRKLIVEGAWWDFVDDVSVNLVGLVVRNERAKMGPRMDRWIDDGDMWIRRAALIQPIKHRADTDEAQLFDHCLRRAHEKEFFIRKAIGWTLREYAKTNPRAVARFVKKHRAKLSPLSFREASKHLKL